MPSLFFYLKRKRRNYVLIYLSLLIAISILYLFIMTMVYEYSSMVVILDNNMYNHLYRRPFGPMGYYALGIMLSIFYFEYSLAVSNRALRRRRAFIFMNYIGKSKKRCFITQVIGTSLLLFLIFISYSRFWLNNCGKILQIDACSIVINESRT